MDASGGRAFSLPVRSFDKEGLRTFLKAVRVAGEGRGGTPPPREGRAAGESVPPFWRVASHEQRHLGAGEMVRGAVTAEGGCAAVVRDGTRALCLTEGGALLLVDESGKGTRSKVTLGSITGVRLAPRGGVVLEGGEGVVLMSVPQGGFLREELEVFAGEVATRAGLVQPVVSRATGVGGGVGPRSGVELGGEAGGGREEGEGKSGRAEGEGGEGSRAPDGAVELGREDAEVAGEMLVGGVMGRVAEYAPGYGCGLLLTDDLRIIALAPSLQGGLRAAVSHAREVADIAANPVDSCVDVVRAGEIAFRIPLASYKASSLEAFFGAYKAHLRLCASSWSPPCPRGKPEVPASLKTGDLTAFLRRARGRRREMFDQWREWEASLVGVEGILVKCGGEGALVAVTASQILAVTRQNATRINVTDVSEVTGGGTHLSVVLAAGEVVQLFEGGVDVASLAHLLSVLRTVLPQRMPITSPIQQQRRQTVEGNTAGKGDPGRGGGEETGGDGTTGGAVAGRGAAADAGGRLGYAVSAAGEDAGSLLATAVGEVCACGVSGTHALPASLLPGLLAHNLAHHAPFPARNPHETAVGSAAHNLMRR